MTKKQNFNSLVLAIQKAFLDANKMSELQHLSMLNNYFNPDGTAKCMSFKVPVGKSDDNESIEYQSVSMPWLTLVPMSSIKMDEITVDFKVQLDGKLNIDNMEDSNGEDLFKEALITIEQGSNTDGLILKSAKNDSPLGFFSVGKSDKPKTFANISVKFKSYDNPEGLMKIKDELVKINI